MDVTICVATYGDPHWIELAETRAVPSGQAQAPTVHLHGFTLHDTRNACLQLVRTPWVIFLDADDELEPGYVDAMAAGHADVRAPAVRYVRGQRESAPYIPQVSGHRHDCAADCLPDGNWIVIGAAARTELVRAAGGFRDFSWSEDWDLWLRLHLAGATFERVPAAVYRAHVRRDSRNRSPSRAARLAAHEAIHRANFPHLYTAAA